MRGGSRNEREGTNTKKMTQIGKATHLYPISFGLGPRGNVIR